MNYFSIEYPNHVTLVVKSKNEITEVLSALNQGAGLLHTSGTIYNPKAFLTLRSISSPDKRQLFVAQELSQVLIG